MIYSFEISSWIALEKGVYRPLPKLLVDGYKIPGGYC